jgi:putative aminopeptidase FrvX
VAAHIDTVHPMKPVTIEQQDGMPVGFNEPGQRTGIGADDKAGAFVCLELLERVDNIAVELFAQEEIGFVGAQHAQPGFFERVGCVLEFDAPANGLVSYTSGGVRPARWGGTHCKQHLRVGARQVD